MKKSIHTLLDIILVISIIICISLMYYAIDNKLQRIEQQQRLLTLQLDSTIIRKAIEINVEPIRLDDEYKRIKE